MILKLLPLLMALRASRCSVVVDTYSQKAIYVSDYCPQMKYCGEATHVMCMYYDPHRTYGPRCSNPRNVTITAELANQLLDIMNAIRSKIANGKETGLNNTKLPRGYGIFRLKWDNELATFAQIFANQCMLRHDFCRATKRFPQPGQTAGLVRFTYPGWDPISSSTTTGLNDDKLSFSVAQILKSWYAQKATVTEDMILSYPNWTDVPNLSGRLYLEIIHGPITHVGCGMSGYTEYLYYQNRPIDGRPGGQNYNSIEIICNFSSRPKTGEKTYWTSRPHGLSSRQCGCPEGSEEDEDCLCNEIVGREQKNTRGVSIGTQTDHGTCPFPENNCEPTLVLLPIFTVEDAPPEKLIERARDVEQPLASYIIDNLENNRSSTAPRQQLYNFFDEAAKEREYSIPHSLKTVLGDLDSNKLPKSPIMPISLPTLKKQHIHQRTEVLRTSLDQKAENDRDTDVRDEPEIPHIATPKYTIKRVPTINKAKKSSIFSRAAQFKLPNGRRNYGHYDTIKSDVKPRKDFKNVQRVVNNYLKRRNSKLNYRRQEPVTSKLKDKLDKVTLSTSVKPIVTTEAVLNNVEEKVMHFNQYLKQKNNVSTDDNIKQIDLGYDDADIGDNKLMTLLDNLEREVKHIDLDGDDKKLFDAKIRKIYGTVVGKSDKLNTVKTITVPKLPVRQISRKKDRESDFLESEFAERKAYLIYDSNNIDQQEIRSRGEQQLNDDKQNKDYDEFEQKYKDRKLKSKDGKYADNTDKEPFNDNDLFENDSKIIDIERKYNVRLNRNKFDKKGADDDNFERNRISNLPSSRNLQENGYSKFDSIRNRPNSDEKKIRFYDKREPRFGLRDDTERNYYRNANDDRKYDRRENKRSRNSFVHEFDSPLSTERRKYYQDKLEKLEKKLHSARSYRRRKNDDRTNDRPTRRMRPSFDDIDSVRPRSKKQGDSFYIPNRARILHGF